MEYTVRLLQSKELLEFIAEKTYQYYWAQNTDTSYTQALQKALLDTEKAIGNLLRAIEAGILNESTKNRMAELETQRLDLQTALAEAKLKENMGLKKEHILYFLQQSLVKARPSKTSVFVKQKCKQISSKSPEKHPWSGA